MARVQLAGGCNRRPGRATHRATRCATRRPGYDYDGARFSHVGALVSFEVLIAQFSLADDTPLRRIAAVVHCLDAGGPAAPEAAGLVLQAAHRIGSRALKNRWMWGIAAASFIAIFAFDVPFPAMVAAAALIGHLGARLAPQVFAARRWPHWWPARAGLARSRR